MTKNFFRKAVGIIIGLTVFSVISSCPVDAFDFFGLLKPPKQEIYQAGGSFQAEGYIERHKDPLHKKALSMGRFVRVDCAPVTMNQVSIEISKETKVTGGGALGRIVCHWYVANEEQGVFEAVWMDWKHEFTFSGKAKGDSLEGQVRRVVYSWEKKSGDSQYSWSAKKKGDTVTGTIFGIKEGDLPFTATVGKVIEVELSPELEATPEIEITPEITPTPSPSPKPGEEKKLKLISLEGKLLMNGKARINLKDGTTEEVDVKNGEIVYGGDLVEKITIKDLDNPDKKLTLQGDDLQREKMIMATQEEWLSQIMPKLEALAKILNDGQELDINQYFEINSNADSNEHQPPLLDFLRKFGFKDKINFNAEQMAWTSDVNTVIHEILGHAFTEVIGEGNKMIYGGAGSHDDPWQPAFKERSLFNPARWFGGKTAALSEDQAKGMALSEGWAQYVGDKWDRELKNIPDEESELTTANAQSKMADSKNGAYGKLYDEKDYGAKVENVVATVFNGVYKGISLEETVADFAAVRKKFKQLHNGKSFQTINQFIYQKLDMIEDVSEKERIKGLMKDLLLE